MRKEKIRILAAIVAFYLILELMGVTCPILYVTGISCAGCGMSRAWLSLLRLDFSAAFFYHPLFWLPVPAAILAVGRKKVPERLYRWGMGVVGVLFLTVYLYRQIFLDDGIVLFHPRQGLIVRVLFRLLGIDG